MNYWILVLLLVPVVLLGIWAAIALAARRADGRLGGTGREDRDERPELTGGEQHKRRDLR